MSELEEHFRRIATAPPAERLNALLFSPLANLPIKKHPLGFFAVRFADGRGAALRLHLWTGSKTLPQDEYQIHDHIFELRSIVLLGALRHETFTGTTDTAGPHQRYAVRYRDGASELVATGERLTLHPAAAETLSTGDEYRLSAGIFHRVIAERDPTVSLAYTRDRLEQATTVGPASGPNSIHSSREPISFDQNALTLAAVGGLDAVLNRLSETGTAVS